MLIARARIYTRGYNNTTVPCDIRYTGNYKKTFPKTFRSDGQNGASRSVSVYRLPFRFCFPFRLPFGRFPQMKKGLEYTERINICTLGTSLYTRYSSGDVSGTAATAERSRMGEWKRSRHVTRAS